MNPLIINLAPTGMLPTRSQSPYVPFTPQEIADDVRRCFDLGVSMVHIHARTEDGLPTSDAAVYEEIIKTIRVTNPEIILVVSTSGRLVNEIERRSEALYLEGFLKPDMASLTLGSMNFATSASINNPKTIMQLAKIMLERGIKPELEVFDTGMVNFAKILIGKGLLNPPFYFNILLGNPSSAQATLMHLAAIVSELPPLSIWSLAGIGRFQTRANGLGVVMGDGVRVGLEDNLWLDAARTQLATNSQLVKRVVDQAIALDRTIATAQDVRTLLGVMRS
jgi:uncharacterized protein (DUF849 family)